MKKKIIIGVSAAVIVIAAIAAGVIMGVSSKKKSSNDINVSCKAVVTKNDDITCYDWLKKLCNKMGIEVEDYNITSLFLSDDNRLEPVFQYSRILILRIRQQDDNLGTIF